MKEKETTVIEPVDKPVPYSNYHKPHLPKRIKGTTKRKNLDNSVPLRKSKRQRISNTRS